MKKNNITASWKMITFTSVALIICVLSLVLCSNKIIPETPACLISLFGLFASVYGCCKM